MHGTFQSSSDRHCQFEQLAVFLIQRPAVVNRAAESIISLPNLWIGSLEILIRLRKLGHSTSSFSFSIKMISPYFYMRLTYAVNQLRHRTLNFAIDPNRCAWSFTGHGSSIRN